MEGVDDSKWVSAEFKTGPENLFTGYKSEMTGLNECTVRWKPGSIATALLFVDGTLQTSYPITADELTAGIKVLTGVANAHYEIRLMNSTFSRGTTHLLLEGDALLAVGGDLKTALDAMSSGDVLILTNGASYGLTVSRYCYCKY